MRREITTLTLGLLLATGATTLHAKEAGQDAGTDSEETTGQPSTLTSEDTRGGATGSGPMDDPVPVRSTDPDVTLERAPRGLGNPEQYNDPSNWGLLGLLGLLGLMGPGRVDRRAPVRRRDATLP
jgi:hypothetical protein